MGALLWVEVPP